MRVLCHDVRTCTIRRETGGSIKQIAAHFGISETCLQNWLRQSDVEESTVLGVRVSEYAELPERWRAPLVEQENVALGQAAAYLSQTNLLGQGCCRLVREFDGDGSPSR